jgi:hypothetical protein
MSLHMIRSSDIEDTYSKVTIAVGFKGSDYQPKISRKHTYQMSKEFGRIYHLCNTEFRDIIRDVTPHTYSSQTIK